MKCSYQRGIVIQASLIRKLGEALFGGSETCCGKGTDDIARSFIRSCLFIRQARDMTQEEIMTAAFGRNYVFIYKHLSSLGIGRIEIDAEGTRVLDIRIVYQDGRVV